MGFSGKVFISTDGGSTYTAIGECREAKLKIKQKDVDATSFDSAGWSEFIPGLKEWEVDTESLYLYGNAAQDALYNSLVGGSTVKIRLLPKNGAGNKGYEGNAFVSDWEINYKAEDAVVLSASFRGTGPLTTYIA